MAGPLEGIRILEWAIWHAGPAAGYMLGDLGAEVIKIEQPGVGDPMRGLVRLEGRDILNPQALTANISFEIPNRNKKSITIDLSKPEGREIVHRLIPKCDVFMQNFRPGVAQELGVDYLTLAKYNPTLIYANVSGYGPKGPDGRARGQDYVGLSRSSMMTAVSGWDEEMPHLAPGLADQMTSIILAYGILAALLCRERTGVGQEIHASILGSMVCLQHFRLTSTFLIHQELPQRRRQEMANPMYNHYKCADGKWFCLGVLASDRVWPDLCQALKIEHLEHDPRFSSTEKRAENCRELIKILDGIFVQEPRDEWLKILRQYRRIICSPVLMPLELPTDPQITENQYVVDYDHPALGKVNMVGFPVMFSKTPPAIYGPAPQFGQHTEEVLLELGGYSWEDIGRFKDAGVI